MRLLVTCASKRGSTAEIAEAITETLREDGLDVDCIPVDEVTSLNGYDAAVVGSAVYMGRWRGDARHFLRRHRHELAHKPFWVFSSGPVGDPEVAPDPRFLEPPRIIAQAQRIGVRGHVVIGGRMPTDPRGPLEHSMVKNTPPRFRDRRDWGEIRRWAHGVAAECKVPV